MTEELAKEIILIVLNYRKQGMTDVMIMSKLEMDYVNFEIDFEWFFEMMSTGAFRAAFAIKNRNYPASNLNDDIVLQTAFKIYWIEQRGEEDYFRNYIFKEKKWWRLFR